MPDISIEGWTKLTQDNIEAIKQFNESYTKAMTDFMQQQMETANSYMEASAKQLKEFSQAKSVSDFVTTQSSLSGELNKKLLENTRQLMDMLNKLTLTKVLNPKGIGP